MMQFWRGRQIVSLRPVPIASYLLFVALAGGARLSIAGEPGQIAVSPNGTLKMQECNLPAEQAKQAWAASERSATRAINKLQSNIENYQARRVELQENKVFGDLGGPKADSEDAKNLALALRVAVTAADLVTDAYSQMTGLSWTKINYVSGWKEVYVLLNSGKSLKSIYESKSPSEFAYRVMKQIPVWKPFAKTALNFEENILKGVQNQADWVTYRNELRADLAKFDTQIEDAQRAIQWAEADWRQVVEEGFRQYCLQALQTMLVNDQFSASAGVVVEYPVLDNDKPNDGSLRIVSVSANGLKGHVEIANKAPSGDVVRYTPPQDFDGRETFTYKVADKNGNTSSATVVVWVTRSSDRPAPSANSGIPTHNPSTSSVSIFEPPQDSGEPSEDPPYRPDPRLCEELGTCD